MKLLKHIPTIAKAIQAGATRPGHVQGVPAMLVGRILVHPALRAALEAHLYGDLVLFTNGELVVRGWFDTCDDFQPGRPALCGGLGGAGRTPQEQRDARNHFTQEWSRCSLAGASAQRRT